MQGEAPKSTLIALFKEHGNAVLVATLSFWQGVDVPGAALRLVVLDKIPFPVPSDPIVTARSQALEESGRNAFMELHVPLAQITLKQGFGRLIRTRTDSGIVALFDPRVHRRGYGRRLIGALPKARTVRRLEEVRAFWLRVTAPQPSVLPL
jgi:ATP-dependent DNA helicase DinG